MIPPIKYPDTYTPSEFANIVKKLNIDENLKIFNYTIQPKYDGSNITICDSRIYTRNLYNAHANFINGLRTALGGLYMELLSISNRYQIFLELGGTKNSPAGYRNCWTADWDYVIFDLYRDGEFIPPYDADVFDDGRFKVIESRGEFLNQPLTALIDSSPLKFYENYEGYVLKLYKQHNTRLERLFSYLKTPLIVIKDKHEYYRAKSDGRPTLNTLDEAEIFGAINKVHAEIGDAIYDRAKALPLVAKAVADEAKKHSKNAPRNIFKYWSEYLKRLDAEKQL